MYFNNTITAQDGQFSHKLCKSCERGWDKFYSNSWPQYA